MGFGARRELEAFSPEADRVQELRAHFARHNRLVLQMAVLIFCGAAVLWIVLYAGLYWLTLLWSSAVRGLEAEAPSRDFPMLFIASAGLLVLLAWVLQRWSGNAAPKDETGLLEMAAGVPLALPQATLAIWGTLRAWQRLSESELREAAAFLETLDREHRLPGYRVPVELPNAATRGRILLALQITELIRVAKVDEAFWMVRVRREKAATAGRLDDR